MDIVFDFKGVPVGGTILNYLLEKSRIVSPAFSERSFHIFYQLLSEKDGGARKAYHMDESKAFSYLEKTKCQHVDNIDDSKDFAEMKQGMKALGFTPENIDNVFRIVMSILWLGQISFKATVR